MTILNEPNPESPADVDASKKFISDSREYYREAREIAKRCGLRYEDVMGICNGLSEEECEVMRRCLFE